MPTGVYQRTNHRGKPLLTAEEKRQRGLAQNAAWRKANPEKYKARQAAWQKANLAKVIARTVAWQKANPEKVKAANAARYAANSDRLKAQHNAYRKAHPEVGRRHGAKYRAQKRKAQIGDVCLITSWETKWKSRKTIKCHWCGNRVVTTNCHTDHVVPLSKGGAHSIDNLCVSCSRCNQAKHAKLPEAWNKTLKQPLLFV